MASSARRMSALTQNLSSEEGWQDLISWEDELYDPLFQGDVGIATTSTEHHLGSQSFSSSVLTPDSFGYEQFYPTSTAPSVFEGPSSFDSRPPSVTEGQSSFEQGHSWLSASPSYTTSATSPLAAQIGLPYPGSVDGCDSMLSPGLGLSPSPFFDAHSFGSSSSYQTAPGSGLFNPHIAGSSHSFSGLDVYASQALDNVGTWVEPSVEPITEVHQEDGSGAMPIPIPQAGQPRLSNTFSSHSRIDRSFHGFSHHSQPRAITIPQPQIRISGSPSDYRARASMERHPSVSSRSRSWSRRTPSILSASPEQQRSSRPALLTRSLSNPRRSRNNKATEASPTAGNFGWVSYQPNTQHRLVPSGAEGSRRRQRGRIGALTAKQRSHAALMRLVGSCSNCKKRKEKCDPGTPCKSCIDHFKGDLVNHPCRDRLISGLADVFLGERHGWHPSVRSIESRFGSYQVIPGTHSIPITFGFGSVLHIPVSLIRFDDYKGPLLHSHTVYAWPPSASPPETHTHAVLPAVITPPAMETLTSLLDAHLSLLVDHHFRSFPPFCSPLRVLRHIYTFYRALPTASPSARLLHQALKLLILVHVGGDITLPPPSTSPALSSLIQTSLPELLPSTIPTPCFIRSQFGSVMPSLALSLMREVLLSLELLLLNRTEQDWPMALAALILVLLIVESIQYHSAKQPYHVSISTSTFTSTPTPTSPQATTSPHPHSQSQSRLNSSSSSVLQQDEEAVRQLLEFYARCFEGCHARLHPDWHGDVHMHSSSSPISAPSSSPSNTKPTTTTAASASVSPEDRFVQNIRSAVRDAGPVYLGQRAARGERIGVGKGEDDMDNDVDVDVDVDMGFFFDRLAARLLVLGVGVGVGVGVGEGGGMDEVDGI